MEVRLKSGAGEPTGTVSLGTGIAERFYGRKAGASNVDRRSSPPRLSVPYLTAQVGPKVCYHLSVATCGRQSVRVIVFTGKGGAGASPLAAAPAAAIAGGGRRTLAFGVGPGLASAFAHPLSDRPAPLAADLWA